jgi:hypothetical protein
LSKIGRVLAKMSWFKHGYPSDLEKKIIVKNEWPPWSPDLIHAIIFF